MDIFGYFLLPVATFGKFQIHLGFFWGNVWFFLLLLATFVYFFLLVATFGNFWLLLATFSYYWILLATRIIWTNVSKFWVKFWENIFSFGKRINFFTLVSDFMGTFICINSFQKCWLSSQINANSDKLCRRRQVRKAGLLRHNLDMFLHIFSLESKQKWIVRQICF